MPTATITAADIVRRYADDIAYVAEQDPATDLDTLASQLGTAARNFDAAGINGHEGLGAAAGHLHEASLAADDAARDAFLRRADKLLAHVWEMAEEYRDMVGD
jgi:hypothetical protein